MKTSDQTTLERQFVELIDRNGPRIRRICRSWSAGVEVEDLEAEVFLQIWRSLPTFTGASNEDTWTYRVALNTVMSAKRKRSVALELAADVPDAELSVLAAEDETDIAKSQTSALHAAIEQLKTSDRALITLWLEELSYTEISEVLGISENQVGVGVHRIKKKLSTLMTGRISEVNG